MYYQRNRQPLPEEHYNFPYPKLGEWRIIHFIVVKDRNNREHVEYGCTDWYRQQIDPKPMMFVGARTVYGGEFKDAGIDWSDGSDLGFRFVSDKSYRVWLFVQNIKVNPIYVLPCDALVEFKEPTK